MINWLTCLCKLYGAGIANNNENDEMYVCCIKKYSLQIRFRYLLTCTRVFRFPEEMQNQFQHYDKHDCDMCVVNSTVEKYDCGRVIQRT